MKTQQHRNEDLQHSRFEADLEARVNALFGRRPTLCGFAIRDAATLAPEGLALRHVRSLCVTEVSVYPLSGLAAPGELCNEIVVTLSELIDGCPEAFELLRERTFARFFH